MWLQSRGQSAANRSEGSQLARAGSFAPSGAESWSSIRATFLFSVSMRTVELRHVAGSATNPFLLAHDYGAAICLGNREPGPADVNFAVDAWIQFGSALPTTAIFARRALPAFQAAAAGGGPRRQGHRSGALSRQPTLSFVAANIVSPSLVASGDGPGPSLMHPV